MFAAPLLLAAVAAAGAVQPANPAAPSPAPPAAKPAAHVLTLEDALRIARAHQPQLREARAGVEAAQARADQARAPLLPQVNGSGAYARETANFVSRPGSLPSDVSVRSSETSWETFNAYNFGLSVNQLLYDFGLSRARWGAARATAQSQAASERVTLQQVLLSVRTTYFQARAAKGLVTVARDTLANQEKHLQQVQGFVEVGTRPEIDLAQARADRANALVQVINAENGYDTDRALLNQAMGVEGGADYDVADDTLPSVGGEDEDTEVLLTRALAARPEFAALESEIHAQSLTVRSLRGAYWPSLSASTGLTEAGEQVGDLVWNWNVGVVLSIPVFQGGLTRAQVHEAQATLTSLQAQADALRQQVRVDVEQARLAVRAAKAVVDAAQEALVNSQEQLRLAEGRYEAGVGSIIELGDAQVAGTAAAQQRVQADYNLSSARAQLMHALGED